MSRTFGRRAVPPAGAPSSPSPPPQQQPEGQAQLLQWLEREERGKPHVRQQVAGKALFEYVVQMIKTERGARVEDLLGILASAGGFACIMGALCSVRELGAPEGSIVSVDTEGGERFYFGDLPNRALIESDLGVLNLALGAARALGAEVSLETAADAIAHATETAGSLEFGIPRLPPAHTPGDLPANYVGHLWPKIVAVLETHKVPPVRRHTAIGFALQEAITAANGAIDPALAARIVIECAVPAARLDPARFGFSV